MSQKSNSRYSSSYSYHDSPDSSHTSSKKGNSEKEKNKNSTISDSFQKSNSLSNKDLDKHSNSNNNKSYGTYSNEWKHQKERNLNNNSKDYKNDHENQNSSYDNNSDLKKTNDSQFSSSCYSEFQGHNMLTMNQILQYKQTMEKMMVSRIPDELSYGYFSVNKFKHTPEKYKQSSPKELPISEVIPHYYDYCADRFISDSDVVKDIPKKIETPLTKQNQYLSPRPKARALKSRSNSPTITTIPTTSDSESIHSIVPREERSRFDSDPGNKREGMSKTPSPKKNQYFDRTIDTVENTFEAVHSPVKAKENRDYLRQMKIDENISIYTKNSLLDFNDKKKKSPYLYTQTETSENQQELQTSRKSEINQNYTKVYLGKEKRDPFAVTSQQTSRVMAKDAPLVEVDYEEIQNESPKYQYSTRSVKERSPKSIDKQREQQSYRSSKDKSSPHHSVEKKNQQQQLISRELKEKSSRALERVPKTPKPKSKQIINSSSELRTKVLTPQNKLNSNYSTNFESELRTPNEYPSTNERRARRELSTRSQSLRTKPEMIIFYPTDSEEVDDSSLESIKSLRKPKKARKSPRKKLSKTTKNNEDNV